MSTVCAIYVIYMLLAKAVRETPVSESLVELGRAVVEG